MVPSRSRLPQPSFTLRVTGSRFTRPALAASLIATLLCPADLVAATAKPGAKRVKAAAAEPAMLPEQRVLHALNRLSFGPTPGQVTLVQREGVEAWFQQQLHPERIDDDALASRLAQYPAMQLSQAELVQRFPTPAMLRQYNNGRLLVPADRTERAVYADAALNYEEKREARVASKAAATEATTLASPLASPQASNRSDGDRTAVTGQESATGMPTKLVETAMASPKAVVARSVGADSATPGTVAPVVRQRPGVPVGPGSAPRQEADVVSEKKLLLALPAEARYARLLALDPDQMEALQGLLKGPEADRMNEGLTPAEVEAVAAMRSPERVVSTEVPATRLLRDVYSERQLQAVMADFWLNHFNVYLHKNQNEPYLLPAYEREAILPHALGRFEDLLVATAQSPAMLVYLDNWQSVGPTSQAAQRSQRPPRQVVEAAGVDPAKKAAAKGLRGINENYARELMELHTLGVGGGYTQQDVIEVAKCFTGWTIDRPDEGGEFVFNPNRHEPGDKTVLGHTIHGGGMDEGLAVLHLLATQPATARFVSRKLAERFVSDNPPPALVDRMSAAFLRSDGDIAVVLTAMFHDPAFWSHEVYRAKVKTPVEFVASALRASGAEISRPLSLVLSLDRLGMPLYGMQTPNGYSWAAEDWVSSNSLLTRMNFALVLSGNRLQGTRVDWPALLGDTAEGGAMPDEPTERRLESALLGQPAAPQTREAALAGAKTPGVQQEAQRQLQGTPWTHPAHPVQAGTQASVRVEMPKPKTAAQEMPLATTAGLLLGSPDFQKR